MKRLIRIATVMAVLAVGAAWTAPASADRPDPGPRHHHPAPAVRLPPPVWYHTPYGHTWSRHGYYGGYGWGYHGHRPGIHIDLYLGPLGGLRYGPDCHW
ncbi:MAG: hypothetical protein NUV77_15970 [Thermoguttaceae bacterium]|jgi:hypothetical protein|nr:hypothetical protein [Thermoguttaceae bacterium]